jgi:hypothetical protein
MLAPGSPCIDAGDPSSPPDPDGSPADIGAIPFDPNFDPTTTWYVDVHATPPGNGSAASPYTSIQQALAQPSTLGGDTVLVAPGTYVEKIELKKNVHVLASGGPLETEIQMATLHLLWSGELEGFTVTGSIDLDGTDAKRCVLPSLHSYSGSLNQCTVSNVTAECFTQITMRNTIVTGSFFPSCAQKQINYCAGPDPDLNPGTGNIIGNPGLWSFPGAENLLAPGSPCIDAGDPSSPPDPDGSPADIGAVHFDADFNPNPTIYCTAKPTSLGCVPQIGFQGYATFHGEVPFVVSATQVHPNSPGLLFYGPGAHFLPFQGAWHCVNFPTPRVGAQFSGGSGLCGGTYSFDFAAHLAGGAFDFVAPGVQLACQWWSRDTQDPTGWGTTLTDALLFSVVP